LITGIVKKKKTSPQIMHLPQESNYPIRKVTTEDYTIERRKTKGNCNHLKLFISIL
jgi:hypothetical protein